MRGILGGRSSRPEIYCCMFDGLSEVERPGETIVGTGGGYGMESATSRLVECSTSGAIRPPIQPMLGKMDRGGRKGRNNGGRKEIHCMDHNKKN